MFKYVSIILVMLSGLLAAQTSKAIFVKEVDVESKWMIWRSYVIDSTYWNVWLPNGELPRRSNGTYLYWQADSLGNLTPIGKISIRLPIFFDNPPAHIEYKNKSYPWDGQTHNLLFFNQ